MSDCLFCKIAKGDIPSKKLYEDDKVLAFHDIDPQAPVHFLVIPKEHYQHAGKVPAQNGEIFAHIFGVIAKLADELGMDKGYRVVTNIGEQGGQTVHHLHFHVLSGRDMTWPPG
ncbi:MAG: histidine triad nucleotide-binding protein [Oscillospiraceae bacterium]|nr:histidine triad nucleotide-binding protein [Oscillospiraceae bacterium]